MSSIKKDGFNPLAIPLWGLFIISLMSVLYLAKSVFIPVFLATLIAFLLSPLVELLRKFYIPRALGSVIILVMVSTLIGLLLNYLAVPAGESEVTLTAEDALGQRGTSDSYPVTLPSRVFTNPVARDLIAARQALALDAHSAGEVALIVDRLAAANAADLPGLGIEFDREAAKKHPFQARELPTLRRLDGSFTNW